MSQIRPVSDLRNNFAEISRAVHETREPIILTKNGSRNQRPEGIITAYDLPSILAALI